VGEVSKRARPCERLKQALRTSKQDKPWIRIASRPSKEDLENVIMLKPMTAIAKDYGVKSVHTIRSWCERYGIKLENRRGYWSKVASPSRLSRLTEA
jgi:hypothetical protein